MKEISQNQENSSNEKHSITHSIVVIVVLVIATLFIYFYVSDVNLFEVTPDKRVYSEEEKLEILDSLSGDPEDIPSVEERRKILNEISNNKPSDAVEYSEEEKLQILRSIQGE
jgi:DNA-directed RNA polymerase subunit H (RpoH/RPB5)